VKNVNRQQTTPVSWKKSRRGLNIEVGTSLPAGKVVPVFATHLLRQDSFKANLDINIEMSETNELLANPVRARVSAYVVPDLALARFEKSRDQFDKSYMGQPQVEGGSVVPFYDYAAMGAAGADAIYKHLGLHAPAGAQVETGYAEAYNLIHNMRLRNRSRDLFATHERSRIDTSLAQAFWDLGRFRHILPSFDQAVMEGEVALSIVDPVIPVKGIGTPSTTFQSGSLSVNESDGAATYLKFKNISQDDFDNRAYIEEDANNPGWPGIYAELQERGVTISLADIEMAKKLQSFAKVRERYTGLSDDEADEYIIDMLMQGLKIPDHALTQPILLKQEMLTFSQAKRYASDSGNMDDSMVSGFAGGSMTIRVPELQTGGIVMVLVECFPQQLFERQADPRFNNYAQVQALEAGQPQTAILPEALEDYLDPEKVDVVRNDEIDVGHATGASTFGYAPKNWKWGVFGPRLGGKFHGDLATTADRQRFWAAETTDPVLGGDFYLVPSDLQTDIFVRAGDPFELFAGGAAAITGLTQFGGLLVEETTNYEDLEEQVEVERIDQDA
jgi:hypothetical protein